MKNIKILMLILVAFLLSINTAAADVDIHFFYGEGCPHCEKEITFLKKMEQTYPELNIRYYELYYNRENVELFFNLTKAFGAKATGVPATFINDKVVIGYRDDATTGAEIEDKIVYCIQHQCSDPMARLEEPKEVEDNETEYGVGDNETEIIVTDTSPLEELKNITLPIIGTDASKISLPVITFVLGLADGFNPCAFFVLFFLLSLLIHAQSRKKMLLIGGIFVFFSALVYFVFMAAWLNLFLVVGKVAIITTIAGIVAVTVALINMKDFFFYKKGVSLSIPDKLKPKLFHRMRDLLKAGSLPLIILGTVTLAITANTYELLCTFGFPMVFTRILTLYGLSTLQYYLYLIFYNIIYIIPLLVIVIAFTITLGAKKLTEWQGRILKLISGVMMLCLGLILLLKPELLNNVFTALALLGIALVVSMIIILITGLIKRGKELKREEEAEEVKEIQVGKI